MFDDRPTPIFSSPWPVEIINAQPTPPHRLSPVNALFSQMQVSLNGEPHTLPDGTTVRELIKRLSLDTQPTAVEVNKSLVPRRKHDEHVLAEGDRIEVVTLVGGG